MQRTYQTPGGVRSFGVSRPTQFIMNKLHGTHPNQVFHPLPPPTGLAPYRLTLESVVPPERIQQITNDGRLVFHATGDTGGVQNGTPLEANFCAQTPLITPEAGDAQRHALDKNEEHSHALKSCPISVLF